MRICRRQKTNGFTLVELLVVTLIISILLTLGSMAFKGTGGQGVTSAVATTEALFDEARSVAIGRGTQARVLIDVADAESESYLRRVAVAYAVVDDSSGTPTTTWKLVGRGYTMPNKTYFSRSYSLPDHEGKAGNLESEQFDFDGTLYDGEYVFYEFNAEGICTTGLSVSGYTGPSFVIGSGARQPGEDPRTTSQGKRDFGGFVIWRNGSTSIFRSPNQIFGNENPETF